MYDNCQPPVSQHSHPGKGHDNYGSHVRCDGHTCALLVDAAASFHCRFSSTVELLYISPMSKTLAPLYFTTSHWWWRWWLGGCGEIGGEEGGTRKKKHIPLKDISTLNLHHLGRWGGGVFEDETVDEKCNRCKRWWQLGEIAISSV